MNIDQPTHTAVVGFEPWVLEFFKNTNSDVIVFSDGYNLHREMLDNHSERLSLRKTSNDRWSDDTWSYRKCDLTGLRLIESPTIATPETFDWLTAMKLFSEGVEIQRRYHPDLEWITHDAKNGQVHFYKDKQYRRKPSEPVEPVVTRAYRVVEKSTCYWPDMGSIRLSIGSDAALEEITYKDGVPHSIKLIKKDSV